MNKSKVNIMMDLSLLLFITLIVITVIFIGFGTNPFFNDLASLLITSILMVITYFTGIVAGLTFSLLFSFIQLAYVSYQYVYHKEFSYGSIFWLFMPALLCLSIYLITTYIRLLELENKKLYHEKIRLRTLDERTQLRTVTMFEDDFTVLAGTAEAFGLPLNTCVIRVRYWDSLRSLMSETQVTELLQLLTKAIEESIEVKHFLYMVDTTIPTWSLLVFEAPDKLEAFKASVKQHFAEAQSHSEALNRLTIQLAVAQVSYDASVKMTGTDFLADGIHSLQYDV